MKARKGTTAEYKHMLLALVARDFMNDASNCGSSALSEAYELSEGLRPAVMIDAKGSNSHVR